MGCVVLSYYCNRGRIISVGRALDCRAGGSGFDSRNRTNTQGLKMTEKWRYCFCPANGWTFAWLGWPRKMAIPSPVGDVKIVSSISTFVLKYTEAQIKSIFLNQGPEIIHFGQEATGPWIHPFQTHSLYLGRKRSIRTVKKREGVHGPPTPPTPCRSRSSFASSVP